MSAVKGKVGKHSVEWKKPPSGTRGELEVIVDGSPVPIRWRKDRNGIWVEFPDGLYGFTIRKQVDDDGKKSYFVRERNSSRIWKDLVYLRAGEAQAAAANAGKRKLVRVRAQMPGKIVKILAEAGQEVEKDQPLLVMEAMKMENEIRALHPGKVKEVKVQVGAAVETGADLMTIE